jgi:hypothetical protein
MEQLARPGTTLLTAETLRLCEGYVEVNPLGSVPVKGLAAPVEVYELVPAGWSGHVSRPRPRVDSRASLDAPRRRLQVPASVQAVLAARIDRLPPEDKRLLQTAAVVGIERSLIYSDTLIF